MHPELFTLPVVGINIKTYGFFLTVGFLGAVWLAMRRANRVKVDPDRVLDISFLALIFGVSGARLFFVMHYWKTDFAGAENVFFRIIDIRQGGLEFLGGFLGAAIAIVIYLTITKQSARLYLDVLAPSLAWGLAFGRLGCFFNGCCFGGVCTIEPDHTPRFPWAVEFPYGSPAHARQWEERMVTLPAELIHSSGLHNYPLPAATLNMPIEKRLEPKGAVEDAENALSRARKADAGESRIAELKEVLKRRRAAWKAHERKHGLAALTAAQNFPSRRHPERKTSTSELEALSATATSLPVHPTQLYSSMHALILSGMLSAVFYQRKRHGVVIGLLFVCYPVARILLEMVRTDNPHDAAGLTISQFVSFSMFVGGLAYLFILYKYMPERSPLADAARTREEEPEKGK
ncbi:MAG: prolipoprotein diacylglyceryl transferase [Planctomycetes bacterium]|nr:prolipoprotein diacylglyceryl transferase [Planctomycetota bacterium]